MRGNGINAGLELSDTLLREGACRMGLPGDSFSQQLMAKLISMEGKGNFMLEVSLRYQK